MSHTPPPPAELDSFDRKILEILSGEALDEVIDALVLDHQATLLAAEGL